MSLRHRQPLLLLLFLAACGGSPEEDLIGTWVADTRSTSHEVSIEFTSGPHSGLRVNCLFGGWHRTRGTAWFDRIELLEIPRRSAKNPLDDALFPGPRRSVRLSGTDFDRTRQFLTAVPQDLRDHSWFIGYAPVDNPTIAFAVFVEHGGHGGDQAAPIAREVLEVYFEGRGEVELAGR